MKLLPDMRDQLITLRKQNEKLRHYILTNDPCDLCSKGNCGNCKVMDKWEAILDESKGEI